MVLYIQSRYPSNKKKKKKISKKTHPCTYNKYKIIHIHIQYNRAYQISHNRNIILLLPYTIEGGEEEEEEEEKAKSIPRVIFE